MTHSLVDFDSPRLGYGKVIIHDTSGHGIDKGVTAVVGPNGSGKTTLGTVLAKGRHAYGNRLTFAGDVPKSVMLTFTDIHSLSNMETQYFAQRMEATMNDYVPHVADVLGDRINDPEWKRLSGLLNLKDVADKKINFLSSGELRKLIIINALIAKPGLLVLDNPYIGLDPESRADFNSLLAALRAQGVSVVMLLCDDSEIPGFTDNVLVIDDCRITESLSFSEYKGRSAADNAVDRPFVLPARIGEGMKCKTAFAIHNGHVRYGDREIIRGLDWVVPQGSRWVLRGPNGSGKSLLLSMVCADHPQGYANDITLFDRRRGSGESIWDIKANIGFVSPEMQLFFRTQATAREVLAEGLRNSLDRYKPLDDNEKQTVGDWLALLGIEDIAGRHFNELSSGQQRLVLVGRALVRQPELLVLDEPLHGLDAHNKRLLLDIIDRLVTRNNSTLIFVTHYDNETPACISATKTITKLQP